MDIPAIIKAVLAPQEDGPGIRLTDLQVGDRLFGRVLKVGHDGKALMDLGGNRASAQIDFPVKTGQTLQLRVAEKGSVLHLQVESPRGSAKAGLPLPRTDFGQVIAPEEREKLMLAAGRLMRSPIGTAAANTVPGYVKSALTQVMSLFEEIPMTSAPGQISQWVKRAVEDRGMLLEKKLADSISADPLPQGSPPDKTSPLPHVRIIITQDVKSQLIRLNQWLNHTGDQSSAATKFDTRETAILRTGVARMLEHIEVQQERVVSRWADGESQQVFMHTWALPDQDRPVRFKVFYREKEDAGSRGSQHRVALLLDMEPLGPVRVDLSMQGRMLQITFFVQDPEIQSRIAPQVRVVETSLAGCFDHVSIDVFVSKNKIAEFEQEEQKGHGAGRIDLNV